MDELNFSRGMSAVIAPEVLPDGMAALICDMYIDDSGELVRLGGAKAFTGSPHDISFDIDSVAIYEWFPANMPLDYDGTGNRVIYIAFCTDGNVKYGYFYGGDLLWEKISDYVIGSNVMASCDSTQFVWVDGRNNSLSKRIIINMEGKVEANVIGLAAPAVAPSLLNVVLSNETNIGTGMSQGSVFRYAYCYVNEFGERSNPSPVLCVDGITAQLRGYYESDNYLYGDRTGSIKSVVLTVPIEYSGVVKVELYRGFSDYKESNMPDNPLKLVAYSSISKGATSINMIDSSFGSDAAISYDNDMSPKGDDIVLLAGTTFISNAVSAKALLNADIYRVTVTNSNSLNYVNQWFRIEFHDKISKRPGYAFLDFDWESVDFDKVRLLANDFTTVVKSYFYEGLDVVMTDLLLDVEYTSRKVGWVQIPYVAAYSETDFYLCIFDEDPGKKYLSPNIIKHADQSGLKDSIVDLWDNNNLHCVPRNQNHIIAQTVQTGTVDLPDVVRNKIDYSVNKANLYLPSDPDINPVHYTGLIFLFDEVAKYHNWHRNGGLLSTIPVNQYLPTENPVMHYIYTESGALLFPAKGWAAGSFQFSKLDIQTMNDVIRLSSGRDHVITITHLYNTGSFSVGAIISLPNGDTVAAAMFSVNTEYVSHVKCHVYVTWEYVYPREPYNLVAVFHVVYSYCSISSSEWSDYIFADPLQMGLSAEQYEFQDLDARFMAGDVHDQLLACGNFQLSGDGYYPDQSSFLAVLQNTPLFPVSPIGARHFDYVDSYRLKNENINFTFIQRAENGSNVPGKIQWGKYGAMPELNYKLINEEILRIWPESSNVPTDEHNTIVIFTRHKKMRLSLIGVNANEAVTIVDYDEIGITNPYALAATPYGLAWIDDQGIFLESAGAAPISKGFIPVSKNGILFYDRSRDWLWYGEADVKLDAPEPFKTVYVYILRKQFWFQATQLNMPSLVTEISDQMIYINPINERVGTLGTSSWRCVGTVALAGKVKTKKFIDKSRIKRLRVDSSINSAGTIKVLTGGYNTSSTTTTLNAAPGQLVALPGLRAAEVQFELSFEAIKRMILEK